MIAKEFCVIMLVDHDNTYPLKVLLRVVVIGYRGGQVLVCDKQTSLTIPCNPCNLTQSPTFESNSIVNDIRKRKQSVLEDSVIHGPAQSLTLMKALE